MEQLLKVSQMTIQTTEDNPNSRFRRETLESVRGALHLIY